MSRTKIVILAVVVVLLGGGIWRLSSYFAATMDWPLVILNAKSDAMTFREQSGNYVDARISDSLEEHLKSKGAGGQITLTSAEGGTIGAVAVSGLTERSCKGLEHHPELEKNFERIQVVNGACAENASMLFWFR